MRVMADIDTQSRASVSFAPPEPWVHDRGPKRDGLADRAAVPVGPGRPAIAPPTQASGGLLGPVSDYPVQLDKVQAPPLRDETLARARLLDWLHVKIHRRAVLVLAEAGYALARPGRPLEAPGQVMASMPSGRHEPGTSLLNPRLAARDAQRRRWPGRRGGAGRSGC
jgi:hypothetical protein